jgi:hypothetical protein
MKRPIKIDPHRFVPDFWFLFPDDTFVCRSDAMVADKDLNWSQPLRGICHRPGATFLRSKIGYRVLETCALQFLLTSSDTQHSSTAGRQEVRRCASYAPTSTRYKGYASFDSSHVLIPPVRTSS